MKEQALESLGLSDREIRIYLKLLALGPSLASTVSKETEIERSLTYNILNNLIRKGFVSYFIKENRKYFRPIPPEDILNLIKEKTKLQEELIKNSLKELQGLQFKESPEKPIIEVYEGKQGMKTLINKMLSIKLKEIISYGGTGESRRTFPVFMKHWHKRRQQLKIIFKVIYNDTKETRERIKKHKEDFKLSEVRLIKEEYLSTVNTVLFEEFVALLSWSEHPFGILIKDKKIHNSYYANFEYLWKIAKS